MLKVIVSKNGFNLSIENGGSNKTVRLGVYPDDDGGYGIEVELEELSRAVNFVMNDCSCSEETKEKEEKTEEKKEEKEIHGGSTSSN